MRAQVQRWLEDLRSPEFAVREAAREGLAEHGSEVPDLLEARRDDADPEVRRTVRLLLERMGRDEPAPAPAPPGDLEALGRVSLTAKGTLPFLLRTLAGDGGMELVLPEGTPPGWAEVALDDVPFFDALETIAAAGGLTARGPFDPSGRLTLTPATGDAVPSDAAGPLRVTLAEVTSVRTVQPEATRRYVVGLDLDWMPTVQLTSRDSPRSLVALDARGRAFKPGAAMRDTRWGYSPSTRSVRIDVHLEPDDPDAIERLEELSFDLPVRLRHDRQTVEFQGPAELQLPAAREVPRASGSGVDRITLRGLERPDGEDGPLVVDLLAELDGETALSSVTVLLLYADGTAQTASTGSRFPSADGTLGLTARAWGRRETPPVGLRVTWFRVEEEGEVAFSLSGIPLR